MLKCALPDKEYHITAANQRRPYQSDSDEYRCKGSRIVKSTQFVLALLEAGIACADVSRACFWFQFSERKLMFGAPHALFSDVASYDRRVKILFADQRPRSGLDYWKPHMGMQLLAHLCLISTGFERKDVPALQDPYLEFTNCVSA